MSELRVLMLMMVWMVINTGIGGTVMALGDTLAVRILGVCSMFGSVVPVLLIRFVLDSNVQPTTGPPGGAIVRV